MITLVTNFVVFFISSKIVFGLGEDQVMLVNDVGTVLSPKIRHSKGRHLQETSPNVLSLLTNFRFSNIRHITLIIRQTGYVFQYFVTLLLLLVYPLVRNYSYHR